MSTKARGDSAEYRVVAELLERGHTVLMPCGDRLPYDIGIDVGGKLVRVQVRRAYPTRGVKGGSYKIDVRRSQTNRTFWTHTKHDARSYDFMIAWIPGSAVFYVIPARVAVKYGSGITFNDDPSRRTRALPYRNAWKLLG